MYVHISVCIYTFRYICKRMHTGLTLWGQPEIMSIMSDTQMGFCFSVLLVITAETVI